MAVLPLYDVGSGTKDTDFIGFSFNGKKSKDLGIVRVSDGSRYNEDLFGAFQDTTVQVPGGDGLYYFRTNFTQRTFNISIAFDDLSEEKFIALRQAFAPQTIGPLIFDERPYKAYSVKVQAPPQFKYICFNESYFETETQTTTVDDEEVSVEVEVEKFRRVYKGEGTIVFVSYYPYASSVAKYLSDSRISDYSNISQWSASCRMLESAGDGITAYDSYVLDSAATPSYGAIKVYNAGDVEADCSIYFALPNTLDDAFASRTITLRKKNESVIKTIKINSFNKKSNNDFYIRINSKSNLIEGCNSSKIPTGTLYNETISSGDFFKIPVCSTTSSYFKIRSTTTEAFSIDYNYLYY